MNVSPEFRRNMWLEMSRQRIVNMPLVLFGIFLVPYLLFDHYHEAIANTAVTLFVLQVILWGCHSAARSIVSEIEDATWDAQRLSPISPWPMCWGKLFGSTIYSWFGGAICLLVYVTFSVDNVYTSVKVGILLVVLGIMSHGVSLMASLITLQKSRQIGRSASQAITALGVVTPIPFSLFLNQQVPWHGNYYNGLDFSLMTALMFCAWTLVACQRLMRQELQYRSTPVVWLGFIIFLPVYVSGFLPGFAEQLSAAYLVVLLLAYVAVFSDKKDPRSWKRLIQGISSGNSKQCMLNLPPWIINLAVLPLIIILLMPMKIVHFDFLDFNTHAKFFLINSYVFLLRDIGVLIFFSLSWERKRAEATALFYLIVLYALLPLILHLLNIHIGSALLQPFVSPYPTLTLISALIQLTIVAYLVYNRWSSNNKMMRSSS